MSSQAAQRRLERASFSVQEGHWEVDLVTLGDWGSSNYYASWLLPNDRHLTTFDDVLALIHPDDVR